MHSHWHLRYSRASARSGLARLNRQRVAERRLHHFRLKQEPSVCFMKKVNVAQAYRPPYLHGKPQLNSGTAAAGFSRNDARIHKPISTPPPPLSIRHRKGTPSARPPLGWLFYPLHFLRMGKAPWPVSPIPLPAATPVHSPTRARMNAQSFLTPPNCPVDPRMRVPVQVCPDRRVRIEIFLPAHIAQDSAAPFRDDDRLPPEPIAHLREWMPQMCLIQFGQLMHRFGAPQHAFSAFQRKGNDQDEDQMA